MGGNVRSILISILILVFLFLVLVLFDRSGPVGLMRKNSQDALSIPRAFVYKIFRSEENALDKENLDTEKLMLEIENLKKDNQAFRSQFETAGIPASSLLPAKVVGFLGEAHSPHSFIIDQGEGAGLKRGMAAVFQNHLVGVVHNVSNDYSEVYLPNHESSRILGKVVGKEASGVIVGGGDEINFENVVSSQDVVEGDIVRTYENQKNIEFGIPDDLVIGKLIEVNKDRSVPLKSGKIRSYIVFPNLHKVFIVK